MFKTVGEVILATAKSFYLLAFFSTQLLPFITMHIFYLNLK